MTPITIDAEFVRAAQACQAKIDVRYYLNGFLLTTKGEIVATNGHFMYVGQYTTDQSEMPDEDTIVLIDGNIPLASGHVVFTFSDDKFADGVCRTDKGKIFGFQVIEGKFPNWERVMPSHKEGFTNGLAIQADYWSIVAKVFRRKQMPVSMVHGTEHESALFTITGGKDSFCTTSKLIIMPMRSDNNWQTSYPKKEEAA